MEQAAKAYGRVEKKSKQAKPKSVQKRKSRAASTLTPDQLINVHETSKRIGGVKRMRAAIDKLESLQV